MAHRRRSLLAKESTFNNMKVLLILAIAVVQINSQGAGYGYGYGNWTDGDDGDDGYWWTDGVEECCVTKKVWGNINPLRDGIYDLDVASTLGYGEESQWPRRCRQDKCIYMKRDGQDGMTFCFARSEYGQSMCLGDEGEKPTGYGSGYYSEKPSKPTNE